MSDKLEPRMGNNEMKMENLDGNHFNYVGGSHSDEMIVGFSRDEGLKMWEVKEAVEGGNFKVERVKTEDFFELYGSDFKKVDFPFTIYRYPFLYSLKGSGCVSLFDGRRHSFFEVEDLIQGKSSAVCGPGVFFNSGKRLPRLGTIAYSNSRNILVSCNGIPLDDNHEVNELFPLSIFEFGPDCKLRQKGIVNLLFKDNDMRRVGIYELELSDSMNNRVIVGATLGDEFGRETASLFDLEAGKEVVRLKQHCQRGAAGKAFHFDEKRQVLFIIGDKWYIDGGLTAHDFRTKEQIWKQEMSSLSRTYSLSIIGDDLWSGTVNNNSMYGESSEGEEPGRTHINVFNLKKMKRKKKFKDIHKGNVNYLNFLQTKKMCYSSCSTDSLMKFFDVEKLEEIKSMEVKDNIFRRFPSTCVSSNSLKKKMMMKMINEDLFDRLKFIFESLAFYSDEEKDNFSVSKYIVTLLKNGTKICVPKFCL